MQLNHRFWFNRTNDKLDTERDANDALCSFMPSHVRNVGQEEQPEVSFVVLRWGGYGRVEAVVEGDGGWGTTGSVASDTYIGQFFGPQGIGKHLGTNYEALTCWVSSSEDLVRLSQMAPLLQSRLNGKRKACLCFLWPVEWQDTNNPHYAGYVEKNKLVQCLHSFETSSVPIRFPHNHNLYAVLGAKDWAAHLCLHPRLNVPCTTKVSRQLVLQDPKRAAREALHALRTLKKNKMHWEGKDPNGPEAEVKAGVVKLGWSWEATDVWKWRDEESLADQLTISVTQVHNQSATVFVQDWIDMDFEMRLFAVNTPPDLEPGQLVKPAHYIYNRWNRIDSEGKPREFEKLNRERIVKEVWVGDEAAMRSAEEQTARIMNDLLVWLRGEHAEPPVIMRFDFMVKRTAPGQVSVATGEMTELGACMLGWKEGPDTLWKAVVQSCLRDGSSGLESKKIADTPMSHVNGRQ